jgi:hypothetical protein
MSEAIPLVILVVFLGLSFVAIHGWGSALSHAMGLPGDRIVVMGDFWVGYLFTLFAVEFFNLWLPIDWRTSVLFYAFGITLFLKFQNPHRSQILNLNPKPESCSLADRLLLLACLTFLVLTCLWAMALPTNEDSWLYHFQSIQWINEYPVVPGLGNLHFRLAFNQSHFGFLALLNFFPYWNKGYAVGGLILLLASAFTVATVIQRDIQYKKLLLILLCVVLEPMARYSASPSPDFAVSLLEIVGAIYLLFLLYPSPSDMRQKYADLSVVLGVSAALCSVKLSGLIFAIVMGAIALWCVGSLSLRSEKVFPRIIYMVIFFCLVHLVRGVITSGVPLYPSTLGSQWNYDWSVPIGRIQNETSWILSCARTGSPCQDPSLVLQDWSWINSWWVYRVPDNAKTLFFASVASTAITTWVNWRGGESTRAALVRDGLLVCPFFSALAFWFFSAPDVRFLGRLLELMFAFSLWLLVCSLDRHWRGTPSAWLKSMSIPLKALQQMDFRVLLVPTLLVFCLRLLPVPALNWPVLPEPVTSVVRSNGGVDIRVPGDGFCWYISLPCAPSADPRLEYREPMSTDPVAHGFRLHDSP